MAIDVAANRWPYRHKVPKDPNAELDYQLDWSGWLADGEAIASATWTVTGGLAVVAEFFTATTTTVWLSGGTLGETATLSCRIVTDSSPVQRVDDRTVQLTIAHR